MNPRKMKTLYVIVVTLGGLLIATQVFGVKLSAYSVLGALFVPVVVVLFSSLLSSKKNTTPA